MLEARDVGSAIRELRGETSQADVAERAGIDAQTLKEFEEGACDPPKDTLRRIIDALGVSEPDFDLRVIEYWRRRIGEKLPESIEGKRLEMFEHFKVIGLRLNMLVTTLDEINSLAQARDG